MSAAALLGAAGPWPLAGHLHGEMASDGLQLAWAGRVGATSDDPAIAWRASRSLERALRRGGAPEGDHRLGLAVLWARVEGCNNLGPAEGADLRLLLVATSPTGTAVSAVGIERLFAAAPGERLRQWIHPPHPIFAAPGMPAGQTGAITVQNAPAWLVATAGDDLDNQPLSDVLPRCGVHL